MTFLRSHRIHGPIYWLCALVAFVVSLSFLSPHSSGFRFLVSPGKILVGLLAPSVQSDYLPLAITAILGTWPLLFRPRYILVGLFGCVLFSLSFLCYLSPPWFNCLAMFSDDLPELPGFVSLIYWPAILWCVVVVSSIIRRRLRADHWWQGALFGLSPILLVEGIDVFEDWTVILFVVGSPALIALWLLLLSLRRRSTSSSQSHKSNRH